jgi:glutaredoxin
MAAAAKQATLYRMVMPVHLCPYGLKSRYLLKHEGYALDEHLLPTRQAQEEAKSRMHVDTTPQTFIDGQRVGGWDELRRYFGFKVKDPAATSYTPVLTVFAVAALLALATAQAAQMPLLQMATLQRFVAIAMCLLAMLKLQDVESFSSMFLGYDLLGRKYVPYAYAYPFAELAAGLLMLAHLLPWLASALALGIGSVGAFSVFKAVYIDKRELKCACVGGSSSVPLGFVSLTENLMMVAMALWTVFSLGAG